MSILTRFTDSSFKTLVREVRSNPEIEPLVKQASIDSDEIDSLPNSSFAWESRRLFPIHSPADAALSLLYLEKNAEEIPDYVRENIDKALDIYDVKVPEITVEKTASAPEPYYLLPDRERWNVSSPDTIKLAENALNSRVSELGFIEKTAAAVRLVNRAQEYGESVDYPTLQKAGMVASDLNITRDWLFARAEASDTHRDAFVKLAASLDALEPLCYDRYALIKLANTIDALDKEAKLEYRYNRTIPDPVETVFNTAKLAEKTVELGGKSVPLSKLAGIPLEYYSDVFGDEILPEITDAGGQLDLEKAAQVLGTMPMDLKRIFRRQFGL